MVSTLIVSYVPSLSVEFPPTMELRWGEEAPKHLRKVKKSVQCAIGSTAFESAVRVFYPHAHLTQWSTSKTIAVFVVKALGE